MSRVDLKAWAVARNVILYRCAWCDEIEGGQPADVADMVGVSDGICEFCKPKLRVTA